MSSKRARTVVTMVPRAVGSKPEMKFFVTSINHTAATATNTSINDVAGGTAYSDRVGMKIKIWSIDGFIASTGTVPVRCDLYAGNDATTVSAHTFYNPTDRAAGWLLKQWCQSSGGTPNLGGHFFRHSLPMGVITKFTDGTATSQNSNKIVLKLTSPSAATANGYVRIWYTDN